MLNLQKGNQLYDFKRQCQKVEKAYWNILTSSLRHPKIFIEEFGDSLVPLH